MITVAAKVAASLIGGTIGTVAAVDGGSYLGIHWTKVQVWNQKTLEGRINVNANVPEDGKHGAFGYAFLTDGQNNALVIVTHLGLDDSSHEDPVSGFHTHVLDLMAPTASCIGFDAEVDLAGSGANSAFDADYNFFIHDKRVEVQSVPLADLGDSGVETIATFTVTPVEDSGLHLCIDVVETT